VREAASPSGQHVLLETHLSDDAFGRCLLRRVNHTENYIMVTFNVLVADYGIITLVALTAELACIEASLISELSIDHILMVW